MNTIKRRKLQTFKIAIKINNAAIQIKILLCFEIPKYRNTAAPMSKKTFPLLSTRSSTKINIRKTMTIFFKRSVFTCFNVAPLSYELNGKKEKQSLSPSICIHIIVLSDCFHFFVRFLRWQYVLTDLIVFQEESCQLVHRSFLIEV